MKTDATFSPCRLYRYELWRKWGEGDRYVMFIGLNPSTADEKTDDPTVRRCMNYAQAWGYGALCMTNLFAYRATKPRDMMSVADPVGPENNHFLLQAAAQAGIIVAAWGTDGAHLGRDTKVREMLPQLTCLRLTKKGHPAHPLYLPKTLKPALWLGT
mgnify:CR=1 FL=1